MAAKGALLLAYAFLGGCASRTSSSLVPAPRTFQVIQNMGSDTLVNMALAWAERYMALHPQVGIAVTGGGTGTGIAALCNGTVQIANASRLMTAEEEETARRNGLSPMRFTVARDAIAVVVHPSNPVSTLSLPQLSSIYTGRLRRWTEVGGDDRPMVLLSRESNSGTYVYFMERVLRLGVKSAMDLFSPDTLLMPSSEGIGVEVRENPNAIGYDGLGYVTGDQKVLPISLATGGTPVPPSAATVRDGTYPVARPLFMYTAAPPEGALKEYLDWIAGEGQSLVAGLGFVPLEGAP